MQKTTMDANSKSSSSEAYDIESCLIRDDQVPQDCSTSAHTVGQDTWKQVGFMLVTSFNCGWILCFSNLMLVPLSWRWGITSLIVVAIFNAYANWLLAGFHFIQGQRFIRYRDMMGFLFGRHMYYVTWISQFSTLFLANMGFILLGGRALKEINLVFSDSTLRLQYYIIITGVVYFIFAFAVPNMSAMRVWVGISAVLTSGYVAILLLVLVADGRSNRNRDYEIKGSTVDQIFHAFCAISAIVACNSSGIIPEIQSTLQHPAVMNMRRTLYVQFTAGLTVYYGVSIAGYWAYGSEVSDYLPKSLLGPKWAKIVINSAVFLQNAISQHMFFQPVHEALDTKFLNLDESIYSRENLKQRFLLRALLFTGNTAVTAAIPFVGDFINLAGSLNLIPLTFIFPSMIFIKVKGTTAKARHKAWHLAIISIFSLLALATTISAIRLLIENVGEYKLFADQ